MHNYHLSSCPNIHRTQKLVAHDRLHMEKFIFGIKSYRSYLKDLLLIVILHDQGHLPDREWEERNSSLILKLVNANQEGYL